jgi:hypothetical protein
MVIGRLDESDIKHPWRCPVCKDYNMYGSLFTYVLTLQDIIQKRTNFISDKNLKLKKINHTYMARRPFMPPGSTEPNDRYRPWLEENIGIQQIDWDWDISSHDFNILEIYFVTQEHATLFELTWP